MGPHRRSPPAIHRICYSELIHYHIRCRIVKLRGLQLPSVCLSEDSGWSKGKCHLHRLHLIREAGEFAACLLPSHLSAMTILNRTVDLHFYLSLRREEES